MKDKKHCKRNVLKCKQSSTVIIVVLDYMWQTTFKQFRLSFQLTLNMMVLYFLPQRDLDFTIDLDFHGELSELVETMHYKMR